MSDLVVWNEELSVGIQEIDEQHKVLVALLNQLHDAIRHRHGNDAAGEILERLAEYTKVHFTVEESLMRILGYPGYDEHKLHHEDLIRQMNELREKMRTGHASISFELLYFLRNWLTNHIQEGDQRYVAFFLKKGVERTWSKKSWLSRFWDTVTT